MISKLDFGGVRLGWLQAFLASTTSARQRIPRSIRPRGTRPKTGHGAGHEIRALGKRPMWVCLKIGDSKMYCFL